MKLEEKIIIMKFNNLKDLDENSLLDKIRKKEYTKLKEKPTHTSIFDDDAVADSAVDYLYSKDNQSKTQSFLKNSGFPSLQDRAFNKQLYGISEEQRQLRDMLKSKTNSILNAKNDYHIEKNNCVNFALEVLAHAGQSQGTLMPITEHQWTLPNNIEEQISTYDSLPSWLPPEAATLAVASMGRYYGYTPSDAAQDLKFASGGVLLNFDGSNGIVTYNGGPRFTD